MALKQYLVQKLEQRLSPQQIQLMKLLQVPTMELDQRIKQEIEENPALEEGADFEEDEYDNASDDEDEFDNDDPDFDISDYIDEDGSDYKTKANNHSKDDEERVIPLSGESTFQEKLTEQLQLLDLDDTQYVIADTIIGNLDESGYLNREIESIVDDLAFSANIMVTEQEKLAVDSEFAAAYTAAHRGYIADRDAHGRIDELDGISAGGMPSRVKCLHALAAHSLAVGPGVNPVGDAALAAAAWSPERCVCAPETR